MAIFGTSGNGWKKRFLMGLAAAVFGFGTAEAAPAEHIRSVEAVTEVFGDGENLSAVILAYDRPILGASVSPENFRVTGRDIQRAYVSPQPEKSGRQSSVGPYVVLELKPLPLVEQGMEAHPKEDREECEARGFHGPILGSHGNPQPLPVFSAEVAQTGLVKTADGALYAPTAARASDHTRQLVVEDFMQGVYEDTQDGGKLPYNLYVPKPYDPKKSYPLVLFMHDAGAVSPETKMALCQGRGAVAWAEESWQKEHPCFVLAPQYDTIIVDDNYQYGPELDRTIRLVESLAERYSIDRHRIYNTGQSMGGMTSIAMDVKYPEFFAASYLVACKWDAGVVSPLGRQNIWAVAAEGDPGAMPSMAEILGKLEREGAKVARQTTDANAAQETVNASAASLIRPDCHIYYTLYTGGSHRYTWQHAYDMLPAMEWVFSRVR